MNQYGTQLQEQWTLLDPTQAQVLGPEYFARQGDLAKAQIDELTLQLAGPDLTNETFMEKVGRINNARMRASEIVMADMPRPVDQAEWEHRFEIWQGGHPIRVALREFQQTMDEIDDRTTESSEDLTVQTSDADSARTWLQTSLEQAELPADLIAMCLEPLQLPSTAPGETVEVWMTPPTADQQIAALLRAQWEATPIGIREAAWDEPSDGTDYFQATQRVASGLPRF